MSESGKNIPLASDKTLHKLLMVVAWGEMKGW